MSGAKDNLGNEMTAATLSGPKIDTDLPAAPTVSNDANGYFVSPAYVKGAKPADAVDVLWRYQGETEWRSVQAVVNSGGDAVVADAWWWTEISLEHKLTQGQTTNVTDTQRNVGIEIATVDAAGNISAPTSKTLLWRIAHIGDQNHLIQQGEKMILAGPSNPGALQEGAKTLTLSGPDLATPVSASYTNTTTPNWIVAFPTEGANRQYASTITLDADSSVLSSTTSKVHVIKKLRVEIIGAVAEKPTSLLGWAGLFLMLQTDGAWQWTVAEDAKYVVLRVPRADSKTTWSGLVYTAVGGERLPWWFNYFGATTDLWWSAELTSKQQDLCTLVTYDGLALAHDCTMATKEELSDSDQGYLNEILDCLVLLYQDDGILLLNMYNVVGTIGVGSGSGCEVRWHGDRIRGEQWEIVIGRDAHPMSMARELFKVVDSTIGWADCQNLIISALFEDLASESGGITKGQDVVRLWQELRNAALVRGTAMAAFCAEGYLTVVCSLNAGADAVMTTYDLVAWFPGVVDWIKSWFGAGEQSMGLGGVRRAMKSVKAVALSGGRAGLKFSRTEINKMYLKLYRGTGSRVTKLQLEQMNSHHWIFKCMGGSNDAANLVQLQAFMHTGRSVGLHWHLLRHMKQTGAITQATYKGLRKAIEDAASVSKVTRIKAALRSAYDDCFRGCTPAVRAWLRKTLDQILPVGGA